MLLGSFSINPIVLNFILFLLRLFNSSFRERNNNFIKKSISSFGLFQFSVEKANNVKFGILSSAHASTIFFTAFLPSLCPNSLLRPLFLAHRPLPSIITAICFGIFLLSSCLISINLYCNNTVFCQMCR